MQHLEITDSRSDWNNFERIIFRIGFIFFFLQAIPIDWKYYYHIFNIQWANFSYRDLFYLARYTPQFSKLSPVENSWGFATATDWIVVLILSLAGAATWSVFDRKTKSYPDLYYLLRVILRYRLCIAVIAYGFIKWFPLEQPYPSLSLLNTNYGDFSDWKLLSLSYAVVPSFESFLGAVEVFAAVLLLFNKSASIAASILVGFIGNIFLSHLGYGGGEWLFCIYLMSMAAVIVWYDAGRWYNLLIAGKPTRPNKYKPFLDWGGLREARYAGKAIMLAFIVPIFGILAFELYQSGPYQYPATNGLSNAAGLYNVTAFKMNGKESPYSLTDSTRWHNVVFETWNTISIRSNQPILPDRKNTEELYLHDKERDFESTESIGRRFYSYTIDSTQQSIVLENKNTHYANDKMQLHYNRPFSGRIILAGKNSDGDEIEVVLDKLPKEYLLNESVNIPLRRSSFKQW